MYMYYAYKERNHGIFAKLMDMTIVKNYKVCLNLKCFLPSLLQKENCIFYSNKLSIILKSPVTIFPEVKETT